MPSFDTSPEFAEANGLTAVSTFGSLDHLKTIGCQASGLISDEDLLKAVRGETRRGGYDGVILATGRQDDSLLAGVLGRDPVHRLRRQWGERLIVFPSASGAAESAV